MPRPQIIGDVIRQIDMNHSSAGKNKDYRIVISVVSPGDYRVYAEYGPANRLNQGCEKTGAASYAAAEAIAEKLRDDKIRQTDSYRVVSDQLCTTLPRPPRPPRTTIEMLSPASRAVLSCLF